MSRTITAFPAFALLILRAGQFRHRRGLAWQHVVRLIFITSVKLGFASPEPAQKRYRAVRQSNSTLRLRQETICASNAGESIQDARTQDQKGREKPRGVPRTDWSASPSGTRWTRKQSWGAVFFSRRRGLTYGVHGSALHISAWPNTHTALSPPPRTPFFLKGSCWLSRDNLLQYISIRRRLRSRS